MFPLVAERFVRQNRQGLRRRICILICVLVLWAVIQLESLLGMTDPNCAAVGPPVMDCNTKDGDKSAAEQNTHMARSEGVSRIVGAGDKRLET
jgi:hypothetical protein